MSKQRRWESEQEIIDAIDRTRHAQNVLIHQAHSCEQSASRYCAMSKDIKVPLLERIAYKEEAKENFYISRKKLNYATRRDNRAKKLSEVLAAFRTNLLPIEGNNDVAVV